MVEARNYHPAYQATVVSDGLSVVSHRLGYSHQYWDSCRHDQRYLSGNFSIIGTTPFPHFWCNYGMLRHYATQSLLPGAVHTQNHRGRQGERHFCKSCIWDVGWYVGGKECQLWNPPLADNQEIFSSFSSKQVTATNSSSARFIGIGRQKLYFIYWEPYGEIRETVPRWILNLRRSSVCG